MMKKKYILPIVGVTIAMLIFIALRISLAYLTDTESADNVITVGSVNLQISEGSFAQSSVIAEGQKLNKAPKIINTGKNDEYVFFKVAVPKGNVTLLYESDVTIGVTEHKEGTPVGNGQQSSTELFKMLASTPPNVSDASTDDGTKKIVFQYHNGDDTVGSERPGWVLLTDTASVETISEKVYAVYIFGYNKKLIAGSDTATNTTVTLFDQIQLKSFIDQELGDNNNVEVDVTAYGIQADELNLSTTPGTYLNNTTLTEIWEILERKQVSVNANT